MCSMMHPWRVSRRSIRSSVYPLAIAAARRRRGLTPPQLLLSASPFLPQLQSRRSSSLSVESFDPSPSVAFAPPSPGMDASASNNLDDYSPSSTVIKFYRPIPLLRGPSPAGLSDDPSAGPFVLAFRDSQAWISSYRACERKIILQCQEGARIGCAISASSKCKPPWWKALVGAKPTDLKEREQCEEREMESFFAIAKEKCIGFARDKCLSPFMDARIAVRERGLNSKEALKLIHTASLPEGSLRMMGQMSSICLSHSTKLGVTNYKASELLDSGENVHCILGEWQHGTKQL